MALLLYYLTLLGVVYLITESWICRPVRMAVGIYLPFAFRVLIYCTACTGFWVGLGGGYFLPMAWPLLDRLFTSAMTTMALGAAWTKWKPNGAWAIEAPIIDEVLEEDPNHDAT